jgi:hypothetical protein
MEDKRKMTQRRVDPILGLFDVAFIPKEGPLWVRWIIGNSSVYEDFITFLDEGVKRVQSQYRFAKTDLRDVLAGQENALTEIKLLVTQYIKEEMDYVAFSEKRERPQ